MGACVNMMRGHLKPIILTLLEKEQLSGSELIEKIEETISWKPSYGSVYPLLDSLVKEGLAVQTIEKKKKLYKLTVKGKKEAGNKKIEQNELAEAMIKVHSILKSLYGLDVSMDLELIENFKKGKIHFSEIHKESMELKTEMVRLLNNGSLKKNKIQIQKILNDTIAKLKKIN